MSEDTNQTLREDEPLLTVGSIIDLKKAIEENKRIREELTKQIEEAIERLKAAMLFVPPGVDIDSYDASPNRSEVKKKIERRPVTGQSGKHNNLTIIPSWRVVIEDIVTKSSVGLTYKDVMDECMHTNLAKVRSKGDKGFYAAIATLIKQGSVVKNKDYLYSSKLAMEIKERGEELHSTRFRNNSQALILEILKEYPKGLTAPQLRDIASEYPDAPKSMPSGNIIYNILGAAIRSGYVKKNEYGIYSRTEKADESNTITSLGFNFDQSL